MSFQMYVPTRIVFGTRLIMIFLAYFTHFIEKHACDERFIRMAKALGKEDAATWLSFRNSVALPI